MRSVSAARPLAIVLAAVGVVMATAAVAQKKGGPSVLTGAYTEEQAIRGQALYYTHCLSCHGEDMAGLDRAPPLAGPQFASVWDGEPLSALVERIATMPPSQPGLLSRDESVAILAYMLWFNGLPIGNVPLASEPGVLAEMTFRAPQLE